MIKVIAGTLIFSLLFLQSPSAGRKSERESDGFVGPVKKAVEEWSPVFGYSDPPDSRFQSRVQVYDKDGRLIQYSIYSGVFSKDENREHYTYDPEGNRTTRFEFIQGKNSPPPPPPPMMPPGTVVKGPPKTTFKYDAQGMRIEKANLRANGEFIYKTTYKYDEKGRLQEMQVIHANGPRYRWIYTYEGEKRFPETEDSFEGDSNTPKATTAYTDYELNSQGDWTKRKQTRKETPGRTTVSIRYRNIEYYPAKN
jgi:hypothetical protein